MMAVDLIELKDELETDPTGIGYAPHYPGNHTKLADLVNSLTEVEVDKSFVSNRDIINALDYTEVAALSTADRETLTVLTQPDSVPVSTNIKNAFLAIFAAGTNSRANLVTLSRRKATRAEVLWGVGTIINSSLIGSAIND